MRRGITLLITAVLAVVTLTGCGGYNKILKASDYGTKYSLAKNLYAEGRFTTCSSVLEECVVMLHGTPQGEESMYLLASCYFNLGDYLSASQYFQSCFTRYPNSDYSESSLFMMGKSLFLDMPDPRLDATSTNNAITSLQRFVETYPQSRYRSEAEGMIYEMYDRLVEKEKRSAELYYNMGLYLGNNYRSCIIVAQNAMRDYLTPGIARISPHWCSGRNSSWQRRAWRPGRMNATGTPLTNITLSRTNFLKAST